MSFDLGVDANRRESPGRRGAWRARPAHGALVNVKSNSDVDRRNVTLPAEQTAVTIADSDALDDD